MSSIHSGTLSLSHCKMLRISGESVSNHHGQINDSNTKQEDARRSCISRNGICSFTHRCKLNQDKVNSVKHTLRNAIVVSLQDAQNQRGKRFKSSRANQQLKHQARRCKKIMHISKWDFSFTHRCKLNQDKVNSVKHALRNAIVVSPQNAQNQRGKRFKSLPAYSVILQTYS